MRRYTSEAIGTFVLLFAGTGAIVIDGLNDGVITHGGIALAFGLAVLVMIYSIGDVSGAHINPAVTVAFWAAGRLEGRLVAPYVLSQFVGAALASVALLLLFPDAKGLGMTVPSGELLQSFLFEVILSAILMFVILHVSTGSKEKGAMAGIAVGATVALAALFGGPVSGASMNPARSFGPALVELRFAELWIYFVGPVVGMWLAVVACRCTRGDDCCQASSLEVAEDNE